MESKKVHVVLYFGIKQKKAITSLLGCLREFDYLFEDYQELFLSDSRSVVGRFTIDFDKAKVLLDILRSFRISCIISDE